MAPRLSVAAPVRQERHTGTVHVIFAAPILSTGVLDDLAFILGRLATRREPEPLVLRSAHPTVFLAGADLHEIAALNAATCIDYANRGRSAVALLRSHPAPTVAAVEGSCSGGGFDLAMACDAIVAGPGATFDHPGVRRGLVTGWSGTVSAPAVIGPPAARAALITGRKIDSQAAVKLGLVIRLCSDPVADAQETALQISSLQPSRLRLWRLLSEHRFVDRFRASVIHKL